MHTNQSSFYGNGRRGVDKRKLSFVFMALTVLFTVGAIVCLVTKGLLAESTKNSYFAFLSVFLSLWFHQKQF